MTASVVLLALLALPLLAVWLLYRSLLHTRTTAHIPASSLSAASSPRRVVVVGGSFAGLTFCRELLHRLPASGPAVRVTLVEPRDWFEYTPGVLRAIVRPSHHPSLLTRIRHTTAGRDGRVEHVQGVCAAVSDRAVLAVYEGGEERWVEFDYCVLAVGSGYSEHIKQHDTIIAQRTIAVTAAPVDGSTERNSDGQYDVPVLATPSHSAPSAEEVDSAAPHSSSSSMCPYPSSAPTVAQRVVALSSVHSALRDSEEVRIVGAGLVGVVCCTAHSSVELVAA